MKERSPSNNNKDLLNQQIDSKFVAMMLQIEKRYQPPYASFPKYEKIRIEQWSKKLCQVTQNLQWKKNRNLYCMLLLDQILNKKLGKPFIKLVPESSLPMLSPTEVKAQLTDVFKKFIAKIDTQSIEQTELHEEIEVEDQLEQKQLVHFRPSYSATPQPTTHVASPKSRSNFILVEKGSVKKPPRAYNSIVDSFKTKITESKQDPGRQAVKSILKHKHTDEKSNKEERKQKSDKKHKFLLSEQKSRQRSRSGNKSIRFQSQVEKPLSEQDDLERQFEEGMTSMKVKFIGQENIKGSFGSQTQDELCLRIIKGLESTGAEPSDMDPLSLQNQVIKLKTDNEILNITLRHLQEELNGKSETIRKQAYELNQLRQTVLDLQAESHKIKQKEPFKESYEMNSSLEKENSIGQVPKPSEKPVAPRDTNGFIYTSFGQEQTNHYQSQQVPQMNVFKRDFSQNKQESCLKPPSRHIVSQQYQLSPANKRSFERSKPNSNSKIARVNKILGKVNEKLNKDFEQPVTQNTEDEKRKSIIESELQMEQFNEEFNKIFNIS